MKVSQLISNWEQQGTYALKVVLLGVSHTSVGQEGALNRCVSDIRGKVLQTV